MTIACVSGNLGKITYNSSGNIYSVPHETPKTTRKSIRFSNGCGTRIYWRVVRAIWNAICLIFPIAYVSDGI